MSVSKWRYTEECNGRPCPGDCDHCSFEPTDLISRADAIEALRGLFDMRKSRAKVIVECFGELLNALPSADAVSRESIMAAKFHPYPFTHITPMDVDAEAYKRGWNDALDAVADNAPSADAVQGWIPCSERLPNESGEYLATIPLDADETYTEVLTFHKGRFYEDDDEWGATYHDDVLAWMPLPKPYKGGDDV